MVRAFKNNHAKGPNIDGRIVTLMPEDLRSRVEPRATERIQVVLALLGQAKVGELDVEGISQLYEDVSRLDVSMDDWILSLVEMSQGG